MKKVVLELKVKQRHIDSYVSKERSFCPIKQAFYEQGWSVDVGYGALTLRSASARLWLKPKLYLPQEAVAFTYAVDRARARRGPTPQPFSFKFEARLKS